jgi:PAS domain S-box-containing protein
MSASDAKRGRLDDALHESDLRLEQIQRLVRIGYRERAKGSDRLHWSAEALRIFGYEAGAVDQPFDRWLDSVHPDDRDAVRSAVLANRDTGKPYELKYRIVLSDGATRFIRELGEQAQDASARSVGERAIVQDITQAEVALRALLDTEARFRAFLDHAPVELLIKGLDGRYLMVSPGVETAWGLRADQILGRRISDLVSASEADQIEAMDRQVRETGEPIRRVLHLPNWLNPDVGGDWSYEIKFPIKGADGQVTALGGIALDISGQKRVEQELERARKESQRTSAFLDTVIEHFPELLFVNDAKDHRLVLINRAGEVLLGRDRKDLIGKTPDELFPKEEADSMVATGNEVLKHGRPLVIEEAPMTTRRKGVRLMKTTMAPIFDPQGKPRYLLGYREDIAERKRAREAKQQLAAIVESSRDAIIGADLDGNVMTWNPGAELLYGYDAAEIIGRSLAVLTPADRREEAELAFERAFSGTAVAEFETVRIGKSGLPIEVSIVNSPIRRENGAIVGLSGIHREIGSRKALESQLRQAMKMEVVGQLTGGIAHDFNNLLGAIFGNLDLILEGTEADPSVKKLAQAALDAAERGADLVQQLLSFSRNKPTESQTFDLNERLRSVLAMVDRTLGEQITVELHTAHGLWPVFADPAQLEQAVLNLAINARDAMPNGGTLTFETANVQLNESYVAHNIEVTPGDYVQLALSDTGIGMRPETLERAFDPFFTTKEPGKGSGLGLSMVFGFAKRSNGHVKLYSEPGHGTTAKLYLPRARGAEVTEIAEESEQSGLSGGQELILVVDDNEAMRKVVTLQLTSLGYRTLEAGTGNGALAVLDEQPNVKLLFSDVVMPGGMSGFDLAREVRGRYPNLRILLTSGYTAMAAAKGVQRADDLELLTKPYRKRDLAEKLRQLLD